MLRFLSSLSSFALTGKNGLKSESWWSNCFTLALTKIMRWLWFLPNHNPNTQRKDFPVPTHIHCNNLPVLTRQVQWLAWHMSNAMTCQFWHMSRALTYHQFWHMFSAMTYQFWQCLVQWCANSDTCPVQWLTTSSDTCPVQWLTTSSDTCPVQWLTTSSDTHPVHWLTTSSDTCSVQWLTTSSDTCWVQRLTSSDNVQCNGMPVQTHVQHCDVPILTRPVQWLTTSSDTCPVQWLTTSSDTCPVHWLTTSSDTYSVHWLTTSSDTCPGQQLTSSDNVQSHDSPVQSQESPSPIPADRHQWQNHDCGCDPQSSAAVALHLSPPLLHTCPCVTCTNTSLTLYEHLKATNKNNSLTESFSNQNYYWSLLYNTILCSRADSLRFTCL